MTASNEVKGVLSLAESESLKHNYLVNIQTSLLFIAPLFQTMSYW